MMVHFDTAIIESSLTSSITICCTAVTAKDMDRLRRITRSAEKVTS